MDETVSEMRISYGKTSHGDGLRFSRYSEGRQGIYEPFDQTYRIAGRLCRNERHG